jgi:hypothetical protein
VIFLSLSAGQSFVAEIGRSLTAKYEKYKAGSPEKLSNFACLTIDVERMEGSSSYEAVRSDVRRMLDLITPFCLATFFVTGEVAENCPEVVKDIVNSGHEVGCHGMWHEKFDTFNRAEQSQRIVRATEQIAECAGQRPRGFRAPQHRANAETLQVLEELDYLYDSSVLPKTPFMRPEIRKKLRFLKAPNHPYYPSRTDITKRGNCRVLELPCSTFFLPFMSSLTIRSNGMSDLLARILAHRKWPIIYYLHSYDNTITKRDLDWLTRLIAYLREKSSLVMMQDLTKTCMEVFGSTEESLSVV